MSIVSNLLGKLYPWSYAASQSAGGSTGTVAADRASQAEEQPEPVAQVIEERLTWGMPSSWIW
jgi:hypothetical protein